MLRKSETRVNISEILLFTRVAAQLILDFSNPLFKFFSGKIVINYKSLTL